MELLNLFWVFFKIGLFTFGGGYAMISMINTEVLANDWLTSEELLNFFAISESTPGPFAINIATFIGNNQFGVIGVLVAVSGVVLPSFIIILIVSHFVDQFLKNKYFKYALTGIKAVVIGLIFSVAITIGYKVIFPNGFESFEYKALIIMAVVFGLSRIKKFSNPILLIGVSAVLGLVLSLIP